MTWQATKFPVTLKDLLKVGVLSIAVLFASEIILQLLHFDEVAKKINHESFSTIIQYLLQTISFVLPIYIFVMRKYHLSLHSMGFSKVPVGKTIKLVLGSFGILFLFNFCVVYIMTRFNIEIPGFGDQEEHISLFGTQVIDIVLGVMVLAIVAPIVEEFIFRGFLLQTLLKQMRPAWASLITASIFGLIHLEFATAAILIFLGILLNRLFLKSNSIVPGIIFHMINNLLAFWLEFYR